MTDLVKPAWQALSCRTEERRGAVVLHPSGEVELATSPILESSLKAILEDGHNVIVNLGGMVCIDSTGIKALLDVRRPSLKRWQRLVLAAPAGVVRILKRRGSW